MLRRGERAPPPPPPPPPYLTAPPAPAGTATGEAQQRRRGGEPSPRGSARKDCSSGFSSSACVCVSGPLDYYLGDTWAERRRGAIQVRNVSGCAASFIQSILAFAETVCEKGTCAGSFVRLPSPEMHSSSSGTALASVRRLIFILNSSMAFWFQVQKSSWCNYGFLSFVLPAFCKWNGLALSGSTDCF